MYVYICRWLMLVGKRAEFSDDRRNEIANRPRLDDDVERWAARWEEQVAGRFVDEAETSKTKKFYYKKTRTKPDLPFSKDESHSSSRIRFISSPIHFYLFFLLSFSTPSAPIAMSQWKIENLPLSDEGTIIFLFYFCHRCPWLLFILFCYRRREIEISGTLGDYRVRG